MSQRRSIAVLFGGRSVEHEISIITALEVIAALDTTRYHPVPVYIAQSGRWYSGERLLNTDFYKALPRSLSEVKEVFLEPIPGQKGLTVRGSNKTTIPVDLYFPAFHGQFGEDGCMQGLFELAEVPYTGCSVLPAAISMNKFLCKAALSAHGIPVLPAALVEKRAAQANLQSEISKVRHTKGLEQFPLFVKPCNLGSSVGIGRATDEATLASSLANVFKYDEQAIVEPCLTKMFEINVSVREGEPPQPSVVEVPVSSSGTLTYEEKYLRGGKGKKGPSTGARGMASLIRKIDPPDLALEYKQGVQKLAVKAFEVLGCGGVVRFDFMVDLNSGYLYFNELNSLPGSLAHYLWAKTPPFVLYTETLTYLIERGFENSCRKATLERNTGFKALFR